MTEDGDGRPEALLREARRVREAAYAPYSGYPVAAVLEADDGRTFPGVNVESASSPVGICSERVALGAAVTEGARSFTRLALVTPADRPTTPCGMCRQALAEFGTDVEIWSEAAGGELRTWSLEELLPEAFRRADAQGAGPGGSRPDRPSGGPGGGGSA